MHTYIEMNKTSNIIKKRYITALSIIALLVLSSHFIMEFSTKKAEFDSRIINIAGRQRMLSQKITKSVFGISISKDANIRKKYIEELQKALELWKKSHNGLQNGDDSLGLPGNNTKIVSELFSSIQINFETMVKTANEILEISKTGNFNPELIDKKLLIMRENEVLFLPVMDKIVFQYDSEAKEKVKRNQQINLLLGILTLLTLALEALFIFRPMTKEVEEAIEVLMTREKELKNMVTELENREALIKQKNEQLTEANSKIMDSIDVAKLIQDAILPEIILDEKTQSKIAYQIIWRPRDIVGGDFYWFKKIENTLIFALVDCTGHGVPGALMTMMMKAALDQIAEKTDQNSPSIIISSLNDIIRKSLNKTDSKSKVDVGADIGILFLDVNTGEIKFSGAKINLIVLKNGIAELIKGDKQSIGYSKSKENFTYLEKEMRIEEGNTIYMTSDGYIDQNGGAEDRSFGTKRFVELLESIYSYSIDEQRKILEETLAKHMNSENQRDDITVLGIKYQIEGEKNDKRY